MLKLCSTGSAEKVEKKIQPKKRQSKKPKTPKKDTKSGGPNNTTTTFRIFVDVYDSMMRGDAEDVNRLAEMTELAREQEIYKRTEQRERLMREFELREKINSRGSQ